VARKQASIGTIVQTTEMFERLCNVIAQAPELGGFVDLAFAQQFDVMVRDGLKDQFQD
jgi:hypothetical protein